VEKENEEIADIAIIASNRRHRAQGSTDFLQAAEK